MTRARGAVAAVACLALAAHAREASAFRTASDSAQNRANGITGRAPWGRRPVPFALNERGSADVPIDDVEAAVVRSFRTWTEPACSGLLVRYQGRTAADARPGDGEYVVQWIEAGWADFGYSRYAIGVTNTSFTDSGAGWALSSADTRLNGDDYAWVLEGGEPGGRVVDVATIVTHEAGHFLGLLHPCEFGALDGAPECPADAGADPATMFPRYLGAGQRTLGEDDIAGICYLYPRAADDCRSAGCPAGQVCNTDEAVCAPRGPDGGPASPTPGGCGCRIARGDPLPRRAPCAAALCALLLVAASIAARRRRYSAAAPLDPDGSSPAR